jgi:hypothetical protein
MNRPVNQQGFGQSQGADRHLRFRSLLPTFAIIAACAAGMALGLRGPWSSPSSSTFSVVDDPTWPLVVGLRLVVLVLSAWIGAWTLVAVLGQLAGHARTVNLALQVLPGFVSRTVRRSFALGVVGALLINTSALAAPADLQNTQSKSITTTIATRAGASDDFAGDVTNGQRWPARSAAEPVASDPDVPTLIAVAGPDRPTSTMSSVPPQTMGATSLPAPGLSSVPQTTAAKTVTSRVNTTPKPTPKPTPASSAVPTSRPTLLNTPAEVRYAVRAGDHFWNIAERTVLKVYPDANETSIRTYWLGLIERNRASLVDPNNPDLLMVGTNLVLPPVGGTTEPTPAAGR